MSNTACCLIGYFILFNPFNVNVSQAIPEQPLAIGESFNFDSKLLGETRRINVYLPTMQKHPEDASLPFMRAAHDRRLLGQFA